MDVKKILKDAIKKIVHNGPDRILINSDGDAVSSRIARNSMGINPDIIFIRSDGWSLGAPDFLEEVAYKLWENDWVGFIRKPELIAKSIDYYYLNI